MQKLYCDWEEENWDALIQSIKQKKCILMLGPDASTEEVGEQSLSLSEILANQLATKLDPQIRKRIKTSDLAQVSQYYRKKKGRFSLEAQVSSFFDEREYPPSELYNNLSALLFYFIITTTPNDMFRAALEDAGKKPIIKWYNFRSGNKDNIEMGTIDKPLLFYLYGSLEDENSLLLTENDRLDFLVALISKSRPLPDKILSELHDKNKCFLFLGFGFKDSYMHWYLRILLYVLQGSHKNPSFAMEQFDHIDFAELELERTVFFFQKSDPEIHIFKGNLNHFVRQLRKRFEQKNKRSKKKQPPQSIDENTPEVFICHANEDKKDAAFLYKELKKASIRPWLDKENLRGGDDWDNRIRRTIKKIDYFVVLLSEALWDKNIGYVNREIFEALDRQKEFRDSRFVIPVKIEKCEPLENLKHLQAIDLTDKRKIKDLVNIINSDFKERRI